MRKLDMRDGNSWDGHTVAQKYARLEKLHIDPMAAAYSAMLARCEDEPPVPDKHEDNFYSGYSFAMKHVKGEG
jgi:hypothetical protein